MTYVFNTGRSFAGDALDGLTGAYGRYLRRVPGASGVISVAAPTPRHVATVVGGGSGHYPAFAGLVGPGLADAGVCGDIFSSPSAEQAYRVLRAVDGGAGVLMLFGNYAGDVMHFSLAADRARAQDGIDARIVLVTDDVASADPDHVDDRRGIAGGFFVFRAAAAAAWRGAPLDEVERLARKANAATVSMGVGFDGCSLPERTDRLFTVPPAKMELGLGIHGEPGVEVVDRVGARELAGLLVQRLLAERPAGATRARVLVNGLGTVKYEELFGLYTGVAAELADAGVEPIEPEVGEFVTSLDMAGVSVSLSWADEELEPLLCAPAASPGYSRVGVVPGWEPTAPPQPLPAHVHTPQVPEPLLESELTSSGRAARAALVAMADRLAELEQHLGELDAAAGDGDHGVTMTRGMEAAVAAAELAGPDAASVLRTAGMAFADAAGGASGALWGAGLTTFADALALRADEPTGARLAAGLAAAEERIRQLGGAEPGDKTLVDALHPFVQAFTDAVDAGASTGAAWVDGAAAAELGARATAGLRAARGRAARLPERSIGFEDAGAVSLAACLTALAPVLAAAAGRPDGNEEGGRS